MVIWKVGVGAILVILTVVFMMLAGINVVIATSGVVIFSYNFFAGHNRGHLLHLLMIGWVCAVSFITALHALSLINVALMMYAAGAAVLAMLGGLAYYRSNIAMFYSDYRAGIRRNYFYNPPRVEHFR